MSFELNKKATYLFLASLSLAFLVTIVASLLANLISPALQRQDPFFFLQMSLFYVGSLNFIFFVPYTGPVLMLGLWVFCLSFFDLKNKKRLRNFLKNVFAIVGVLSLTPFTIVITLIAWPEALGYLFAVSLMKSQTLRKWLNAD